MNSELDSTYIASLVIFGMGLAFALSYDSAVQNKVCEWMRFDKSLRLGERSLFMVNCCMLYLAGSHEGVLLSYLAAIGSVYIVGRLFVFFCFAGYAVNKLNALQGVKPP